MRILLALPLALAACAADPPRAPVPYWHRSAGDEQWRQDRYECLRDASAAAPPSQRVSSSGGYMIGTTWIPPRIDSYDDSSERRLTLTRLCLEARGWRQSPTDPFASTRAPGAVARLAR